jgi:hypothetical protein
MIRSPFVVPLVIAASLGILAACGGDDDEAGLPLSRDEYFRELQGTFDDLQDSFSGFEYDLSDDPSDEESYDATVDFYERVAGYTEELSSGLASITPPVSLADMHSELVAATEDSGDPVRSIVEEFESVDGGDIDGLRTVVLRWYDDLGTTSERLKIVCTSLEEESAGEFTCDEDGDVVSWSSFDIAPGITGELRDAPPLPDGYEALSTYIAFRVDGPGGQRRIGLPLDRAMEDASDLGWYSYEDGEWRRLDVPVRLIDDGSTAEGEFDSVPPNLIALRER